MYSVWEQPLKPYTLYPIPFERALLLGLCAPDPYLLLRVAFLGLCAPDPQSGRSRRPDTPGQRRCLWTLNRGGKHAYGW